MSNLFEMTEYQRDMINRTVSLQFEAAQVDLEASKARHEASLLTLERTRELQVESDHVKRLLAKKRSGKDLTEADSTYIKTLLKDINAFCPLEWDEALQEIEIAARAPNG